jgi:hypothetical protein
MTSSRFGMMCALLALAATTACTDTESATNLQPDGPPMIEQVILTEAIIDTSGSENDNRVIAFGTLPGFDSSLEHSVSSASITGQKLRIVFDELLKGNRLEEISCRANIGPDGAYSKVPDGATPDDIAKCAVAQDVLKQSCFGDHAVCLCQLDGGCIVGADMVNKGDPVGVLDVNQDGAADQHRFIPDSVQLQCGSTTIPADPAKSYWYPSGDQQIPATGGFEAIGPAVVFIPSTQLPTNQSCQFKFADDVVDKTDIQVCAPPGGRTSDCSGNIDKCVQNCTPGDVSAFTFKTAPLTLANNSFASGDLGVDKTQPIILIANTLLDTTTITPAITMTQAGMSFSGFTVSNSSTTDRTTITITPNGGAFQGNTMYTLTIAATLKDKAGQPLPMPISYTFTTGA